jgi:hypothetical protein
MKNFAFAVLSTAALLAGCSASSESTGDSGSAVAASPLKGNIDGKDFQGKSAVARKSGTDGKRSITVYDMDVKCEDFSPKAERELLTSIEWVAGTTKNLKLDFADLKGSQTVTFVISKGGSPTNVISNTGRIEVIEAPTDKGSVGKIRIRASAQAHSVEGEIAVQVCE